MKRTVAASVLLGIVSVGLALVFFGYVNRRHGPSLEARVAAKICAEITRFVDNADGRWPSNWLQLTNMALQNSELLQAKGVVIPEEFAFVPTRLSPDANREGQILVMSRAAVRHDGRAGRYYVYFDAQSEAFFDEWIPETEAQRLLKKHKVVLPPPTREEVIAAQNLAKQRKIGQN